MTIFLIEYNRSSGKLIELLPFADSKRWEAEDERLKRELTLRRAGSSNEVVLLEASTQEALRHTHRRYFEDPIQILNATGS